ncbi:MAG: hypothetical protein ACRDKT_13545 [Actinomycetota bacterium]
MARTRWGTRAWLGGLAFSGVIAAHVLAYAVAAPHSHHRTELLAATGHGSWTYVVALALGCLVAGLGGIAWSTATTGEHRLVWSRCALRLVLLQTLGFTALEVGERLLHGVMGAELIAEPVFVIGLIAQVVVALFAAVLLRLLIKVVARLTRRAELDRAEPSLDFVATDVITRRVLVAVGAGTLRGPPAAG